MPTKLLRIGFYQPEILNDPTRSFDWILQRFDSAAIPEGVGRTWDDRNEPVATLTISRIFKLLIMILRMNADPEA